MILWWQAGGMAPVTTAGALVFFSTPVAFLVLNPLNHAFFWGMALAYFDPHPGGI